jgi:hypothetical protein
MESGARLICYEAYGRVRVLYGSVQDPGRIRCGEEPRRNHWTEFPILAGYRRGLIQQRETIGIFSRTR